MGKEDSTKNWRVVYGPVGEAAARAHLAAAFEDADAVSLPGLRRIQVRKLPGGKAELIAPPIERADILS